MGVAPIDIHVVIVEINAIHFVPLLRRYAIIKRKIIINIKLRTTSLS